MATRPAGSRFHWQQGTDSVEVAVRDGQLWLYLGDDDSESVVALPPDVVRELGAALIYAYPTVR